MQDSRDNYRCLSNSALIEAARREGVTVEMGVVLAERLAERFSGGETGGYGNFNPRNN